MYILKGNSVVYDAQALKLPLAVYNDFSQYQYAFVQVSDNFKVISKIELADDPLLSGCCYLALNVIKPSHTWTHFNVRSIDEPLEELTSDKIVGIDQISVANFIEVTVVILNVKYLSQFRARKNVDKLLCDVLKLFAFTKGCILMLDKLPKSEYLDCYCLIVDNLPGRQDALFTVNDKTKIVIKEVCSYLRFEQRQSSEFNRLFEKLFMSISEKKTGTFNRILNHLSDLFTLAKVYGRISSSIKPEKSLVIIGQPGCGKLSLVKSAAHKNGFIIHKVHGADLFMAPVASAMKKLKEVFEEASLHALNEEPCVIYLKDVDLLCEKKNNNVTQKSYMIVQSLVDLLKHVRHTSCIAVVASSTSPENIDERLRRAGGFNEDLEIPMLSEEERETSLKRITEFFKVPCDEEIAANVATWTPGFVLADLMNVVKVALYSFQIEQVHDLSLQERCFKKAVSMTVATANKGARGLITSCKINFSDIGGLEEVKKLLQMSVLWPMRQPEAFVRLGIPQTKGILLYGPPGCAKTMLVRATAFECNATFLAVSSADLYSPYVGESEKRLAKLFTQARIAAPSIIFIDEIDALIGNKDGRERGVQERLLATLLVEMDGVGTHVVITDTVTKVAEQQPSNSSSVLTKSKIVNSSGVIVIGATNRLELIDEALKRPGRFDKLIYVPPPNEKERLAILKTVTRKMSLGSDVDLETISKRTDGFSGADLKSLCCEAALFTLSSKGMDAPCIHGNEFDKVLESFVPSLRSEMS